MNVLGKLSLNPWGAGMREWGGLGKEPVVAMVTQGEESSRGGQSQGLGVCLLCTSHHTLSLLDCFFW